MRGCLRWFSDVAPGLVSSIQRWHKICNLNVSPHDELKSLGNREPSLLFLFCHELDIRVESCVCACQLQATHFDLTLSELTCCPLLHTMAADAAVKRSLSMSLRKEARLPGTPESRETRVVNHIIAVRIGSIRFPFFWDWLTISLLAKIAIECPVIPCRRCLQRRRLRSNAAEHCRLTRSSCRTRGRSPDSWCFGMWSLRQQPQAGQPLFLRPFSVRCARRAPS